MVSFLRKTHLRYQVPRLTQPQAKKRMKATPPRKDIKNITTIPMDLGQGEITLLKPRCVSAAAYQVCSPPPRAVCSVCMCVLYDYIYSVTHRHPRAARQHTHRRTNKPTHHNMATAHQHTIDAIHTSCQHRTAAMQPTHTHNTSTATSQHKRHAHTRASTYQHHARTNKSPY